MNFLKKNIRYFLAVHVLLILVIGLVLLFTVTYSYNDFSLRLVYKQVSSIIISVFCAFVIYFFPLDLIKRYYLIISIIFLVPVIYLFIISIANNLFELNINFPFFKGAIKGSYRWLSIFGFSLQPAEFIKIAVIIFFSYYYYYLSYKNPTYKKKLIIPTIISGAIIIMILSTRSVSMTIITSLLILHMFFLVKALKLPHLIIVFIIAVLFLFILFKVDPVSNKRISIWLNKDNITNDSFYQINRAKAAIGSGGLWGKGLGKGVMKKKLLPESHNDFIFAIIGEELGFVLLVMLVIAIYFPLFFLCLKIAYCSQTIANVLISGSICFYFILSVLLHLGVVSSLLPTTGTSAIFIGYGGSNMLSCLMLIGLICNVDKENDRYVQEKANS